jgi:hypothetical protein
MDIPEVNPDYLEAEKENLLIYSAKFIDNIDELMQLKEVQLEGRPRAPIQDILKGLLIMSWHGFSYRRAQSDLKALHERGYLKFVPSKSTLNKYMQDKKIEQIVEGLIPITARVFAGVCSTLILDSTAFSHPLRLCGGTKGKDGSIHIRKDFLPSLMKSNKLHVAMFKEYKIIALAKTSKGTVNDSIFFETLVKGVLDKGFQVKKVLADKGYTSKKSFALCEDLGIEAFIDFRDNSRVSGGKSILWGKMLKMKKNNPNLWKKDYNFRPLIESAFSSIKRRNHGFIRSRNETAKSTEMLLKALWYNLTKIGKHYG